MLWTWKWRKFKRTLNICFFHLSAKSSECVDATAKNWSLNSVQFNQSCPALCDPTDYSMPGFPAHHQLPELAQTHVHWVVMTSSHFILYCPLLFLPSIFPSIRGFSNESVLCISWPKYCSFSFSILNSFPYGVSYACWITREIFCFCCLFASVKQVTISEWFTILSRFGIVFKFVLLLWGNKLRFA